MGWYAAREICFDSLLILCLSVRRLSASSVCPACLAVAQRLAMWFHNVIALEPCLSVNVFWRDLPRPLYEPKDIYGNKVRVPVPGACMDVWICWYGCTGICLSLVGFSCLWMQMYSFIGGLFEFDPQGSACWRGCAGPCRRHRHGFAGIATILPRLLSPPHHRAADRHARPCRIFPQPPLVRPARNSMTHPLKLILNELYNSPERKGRLDSIF